MKTLKQIENDPRVSQVEKNSDYDPDYEDSNSKYFLWIKDGYIFEDGTHMACANTVAELNELLKEIEKE